MSPLRQALPASPFNVYMKTTFTLLIFLALVHVTAFGQFGSRKALVDFTFKSNPTTMAVGDLNNDNRPDLVVTSDHYAASASYFIQNSNGTFAEIQLAGSKYQGSIGAIEVIDLDGNGYKDIVALTENSYNYGSNRVLVWYNDYGTISGSPKILVDDLWESGTSFKMYFHDMDKDGKPDIVLPNLHKSYKAVWLQNKGRNGYWQVNQLSRIDAAQHLLVADLDADGVPEIVNNSYIMSGPDFSNKKDFAGEDVQMTAVDMDRDGDMDIVASPYFSTETLSWYENKGNLVFQKHEITGITGNFKSVLVQDFNGDGLPDIVLGCPTTCQLKFLQNKGKGQFTLTLIGTSTPGIINQGAMRAADMDLDGQLDLVITDYAWRLVGVYRNEAPAFEGVSADFRVDVTPCSLAGVKFTDLSLGKDIVSWSWSFGDGNKATTKNAVHTYAAPGQYNVTLQARKSNGTSSSLSKSVTITSPPAIQAKFEIFYCDESTPFTLTIAPAEQGTYYKWFGDSVGYNSPLIYSGNSFQLSREERIMYVEKVNQQGCASKRVPVYMHPYPSMKPPLVEDAISYKGPATLRLEALDPDGRKDITFHWYETYSHNVTTPIHIGPVYERHFSQTQALYVQAVSNTGCISSSKTRATAYVHNTKPLIPYFAWVKEGGSTDFATSRGITGDTSGSMLTVGEDMGFATVTMENTSISVAPTDRQGRSFYLFKHGSDGKVLSGRRILNLVKDSGWLSLQSFFTDDKNNIYLTGKLEGTVEIAEKSTWSANGYFVIKLSPAGEVLWHKRVASKDEYTYSSAYFTVVTHVSKNGTITCDLMLYGSAMIEGQQLGSPYYRYYQNEGYWSRYVLQYSADGTLTSTRMIAAMDYYVKMDYYPYNKYFAGPSFTVTDSVNTIYQIGAFKSRTWLDQDTIHGIERETLHGSYSDSVFTTVLIKYAANGKRLWNQTIASGYFGATPKKILYHDNSLYVLGTSKVRDNLHTRVGNVFIDNAQVFLAKLDTAGNVLWVKAIEGKNAAAVDAYDLLIDKAGDPYVFGTSTGPASFDGLLLKPTEPSNSLFSYIVKYTRQGELSWAKSISNVTSFYEKSVHRLYGSFDHENQLVIHSNYDKGIVLDDFVLPQNGKAAQYSNLYTAKLGYKLVAAMHVGQGCSGMPISFEDETLNTPTEEVISREWAFGDGTTSTEALASHTYAKPGQYQVKLHVRGSKGTSSTIQQTVTVEAAPLASITVNGLQLIASEGDSYRWSRNDSLMLETTKTVLVTESGRYRVAVMVGGCESVSEEIQVSIPVVEGKVTAFPNPASSTLTLESKEQAMVSYAIYNLSGHLVIFQKLPAVLTHAVDIRNLLSGLYIIQIEMENGKYVSYKFIKN